MRTSYSSLQTYKQCPQKYKFQEIERVPAKKLVEAVFGTHIHNVLKRMFEKDPLFPTLDELLDYYRTNWPDKEKVGWDETTEKIYFDEGAKMIKNFYAKNAPWNFNVVDLESRFEVPISDEKHGTTHVLAGKIDRIDKIGENEFEVIDYKTAKRLPSQDTINHDLQLSLYGLGLKKRWPHLKTENIKLSLYFLKHQEKLSTVKTEKEIEATAQDALGAIEEIEKKLAANERFEPMPSALCDWCSYKPICPAWKHLYRNRQQITDNNIEPMLKEYLTLKKEEQKNEQRLKELQKEIGTYMDAQGFDRLFDEEGIISRKLQKRVSYDFEKIRHILEPIGKWQDILDADDKKLKNIMSELPPDIQKRIQSEGIIPKEFFVITTTLKKQNVEKSFPQENFDKQSGADIMKSGV